MYSGAGEGEPAPLLDGAGRAEGSSFLTGEHGRWWQTQWGIQRLQNSTGSELV
jgi:hypothetical protein